MRRVMYKTSVAKAQKRKKNSPTLQAVVVSGFFAAPEPGRKRFQLVMKNGEKFPGKIDERLIDFQNLRKLRGQQVTIKGMLHFQASGKPRLLEAQMITLWQPGDEAFEAISVPLPKVQIRAQVHGARTDRNLAAEIWGKWPGNESIDQLLDMLRSPDTTD